MTVITGSVGASSAVVARHLGQGPPADQGKQPPGCLVPYGHHQAPTPPPAMTRPPGSQDDPQKNNINLLYDPAQASPEHDFTAQALDVAQGARNAPGYPGSAEHCARPVSASLRGSDTLLMKMKTLNNRAQGKHSVPAAIMHNKRALRERPGSAIDPTRSHLNISLFDLPTAAAEVIELGQQLLADSGFVPPRVDTVTAVEGVFFLFEAKLVSNMREYFEDCATWLVARFGGQLLSADIHLDEEHPHCHVIMLLPLVNGELSGSSFLGDKARMSEHRLNFFESVARRYGFLVNPTRMSNSDRRLLSKRVHERLRLVADPVLASCLWPRVSYYIDKEPLLMLNLLGLQVPQKPSSTIRQLAQTAGKGAKTAAEAARSDRRLAGRHDDRLKLLATSSPLGAVGQTAIDVPGTASAHEHLPCVGVGQQKSLSKVSHQEVCEPARVPETVDQDRLSTAARTDEPLPSPVDCDYTRERDDWASDEWDGETGSRRAPPEPGVKSGKISAKAWVASLVLGIDQRTACGCA